MKCSDRAAIVTAKVQLRVAQFKLTIKKKKKTLIKVYGSN